MVKSNKEKRTRWIIKEKNGTKMFKIKNDNTGEYLAVKNLTNLQMKLSKESQNENQEWLLYRLHNDVDSYLIRSRINKNYYFLHTDQNNSYYQYIKYFFYYICFLGFF